MQTKLIANGVNGGEKPGTVIVCVGCESHGIDRRHVVSVSTTNSYDDVTADERTDAAADTTMELEQCRWFNVKQYFYAYVCVCVCLCECSPDSGNMAVAPTGSKCRGSGSPDE